MNESEIDNLLKEAGDRIREKINEENPISAEQKQEIADAAGAGWEKHQEELKQQTEQSVQEEKSAEQKREEQNRRDQQQERDR